MVGYALVTACPRLSILLSFADNYCWCGHALVINLSVLGHVIFFNLFVYCRLFQAVKTTRCLSTTRACLSSCWRTSSTRSAASSWDTPYPLLMILWSSISIDFRNSSTVSQCALVFFAQSGDVIFASSCSTSRYELCVRVSGAITARARRGEHRVRQRRLLATGQWRRRRHTCTCTLLRTNLLITNSCC